ncbi:MAG: alanine--tRNA ligase [archaeon]|nr:MAG: alanine--tRNA ligase [archaeon]
MNEKKEALKSKFSSDYKRYYLVDLFKREGFVRKKCQNCGRFFWTLVQDRRLCDEPPCSPYSFIGNPITKKKLGRTELWRTAARYFKENGHHIVNRYPVVSRWRPDLYFTVASIIDFQRIEAGKVIFQLPVNPLLVPQVCLRFNDIPSVGVSGKHGTSFVMMGQTALDNKEGYWKDRCIDLDFELLTKRLGVSPEELTFNEEVWVGYGAFGYSLEYFARGAELGNAVFTAFEGEPSHYSEMKERVVDMGAGLDRWVWASQGAPNIYEANYGSLIQKMKDLCKVEVDRRLFMKYSKLAGTMNVDEFGPLGEQRRLIAKKLEVDSKRLEESLAPVEAIYSIADHAQTLLFGIADGMLPSNSGGGYNLRILYRRASNFINHFRFPLTLSEVVNWQIEELKAMYPELAEHRDDVAQVLKVEEGRHASTTERVSKIVSSVSGAGGPVSTEQLIKLYDSDGVTPEQLMDAGAKVEMPEDFYEKVQARHVTRKVDEPKAQLDVGSLPATKLLYYGEKDDFEFSAKVLKVLPRGRVVLDRTFFYPRGGGQEPDRGTIGTAKVVDVEKYGEVVIHSLGGPAPKAGAKVTCKVEVRRRTRITQIHTATHILNGSSRQVLGPWVWQHSAFKEEDYGRLDITHFSHLTPKEVQAIEDLANEVVRKNLTIKNTFMPRQVAEQKYGFRLYQGGVVPGKSIRVVDIGGWDIEACGGTHTRTTGAVGFIKVTKVERIQDGVERLEFVAGEAAIEYMHRLDVEMDELSDILGTQRVNLPKVARTVLQDLDQARAREKALGEAVVDLSSSEVSRSAKPIRSAKLYVAVRPPMGEDQIIAQGQKSVEAEPSLIYVSIFPSGNSGRVVCFVGAAARQAGYSAGDVIKKLASSLGGSGGGSPSFAQGGGPKSDKIEEAARLAETIFQAQTS